MGRASEKRRKGNPVKANRSPHKWRKVPGARTDRRSARDDKSLKVVVLGAGRLGSALTRALASSGYDVVAVASRTRAHAERASKLAGASAIALTLKQLDKLPEAAVFFITTRDDVIRQTATALAGALAKPAATPRICAHTSGALSYEELAPLRARGFALASLHPIISVSNADDSFTALTRAYYSIEGDKKAVSVLRKIVGSLGGKIVSIQGSRKAFYHSAAVIACGHMAALFDAAAETMTRCGLSTKQAERVISSLVASTLDNIKRFGPARALTGPFARGDVETVKSHLAALESAGSGEILLIYRLLGKRSLHLAREHGGERRVSADIRRLLEEAEPFAESVRVRLAAQLDSLPRLLESVSDDVMKRDGPDGKWSIHANLAHLVRHHQVMLERISGILINDNPLLERYRAETDPEWPSMVARPTEEVMALLRSLRAELLRVVDRLSPAELSRPGTHPLMGVMDLTEWIDFFLLHEAHHLYNVRLRAGNRIEA